MVVWHNYRMPRVTPSQTPATRVAQTAVPAPVAAPQPMIEADVRLALNAQGAAAANGTVKLEAGFMQRLITHLLRSPKRFRSITVGFDAATHAYTVKGQVKFLGMWFSVSGRGHATTDAGQPAVAIDDVRLGKGKGFSMGWMRTKVTKFLAEELKKTGITAASNPQAGVVRFNANALLHEVKVLPAFADLDLNATRFTVATDARGGVTVGLQADAQGPTAPNTPASDITLSADPVALRALLARALASSYELADVTLSKNGLNLAGKVEYKPLSDAANGMRSLLVLIAHGRGGTVGNPSRERVMGPLRVAVEFDGMKAVITPNPKAAVKELAKSFEKAGVPYTVTKTSIQADLGAWLTGKGIAPTRLALTPEALEAIVAIDLDARLKNPALRPPGPTP